MTLLASAKISGITGGTTPGINGTGGKIGIAHLAFYAGAGFLPTITDNYGNTWNACGIYFGTIAWSQLYFAPNLVTGSGHTLTVSGPGGNFYATLTWEIHDGITSVAPYAGEIGATTNSASSLATGSLSYDAGSLLSSGFSATDGTSGLSTVDNSFSISQQNTLSPGAYYPGAQASKYAGAAGSVNPTWSVGAGSGQLAAVLAAFYPDTVYSYADPLIASAQVNGQNGGTSGTFDSTGANFLLASAAFFNNGGTFTLTDSKGNTFAPCTRHDAGGNGSSQFFHCNAPVVGSLHTVTSGGANTYSNVSLLALNLPGPGPYSLDQENSGATVLDGGFLAIGSITPTRGSSLIASHVSFVDDNYYPPSVNRRQLLGPYTRYSAGVNAGGRIAYGLQDSAPNAVNPRWVGFGGNPRAVGSVVSFIPAASAFRPSIRIF